MCHPSQFTSQWRLSGVTSICKYCTYSVRHLDEALFHGKTLSWAAKLSVHRISSTEIAEALHFMDGNAEERLPGRYVRDVITPRGRRPWDTTAYDRLQNTLHNLPCTIPTQTWLPGHCLSPGYTAANPHEPCQGNRTASRRKRLVRQRCRRQSGRRPSTPKCWLRARSQTFLKQML